jgi:hypothetical protein
MKIHQIQIGFDEQEDRLLLRVSTTDGCEYRFWLTRRFTKQLWVLLLKMLEWDRAVQGQLDTATRHTVLEIQHEGYAQQGDFSRNFEERPHRMPLGEAPILLFQAKGIRRDQGLQVLNLHPRQGQGLDLTLDTRLLHILAKLLRDAAARTGWDVNLALHEQAAQGEQATVAPARKLN